MAKIVAYLRVSSRQQGRSGLGLEAQREAIIRGALWSSKMGAHGGFTGGWSLTSGRAALPSLPAQALVDLLTVNLN